MKLHRRAALALGLAACLATPTVFAEGQVNVYSARKEALIKPLLDQFTEQTGIKVRLLTGKADGLLKRLQIEGRSSPADVFITVDAGRLHRAKEAGILQPIKSSTLDKVIPEALKDPEGQWYGLSQRARPIFYAKERVNPKEIKRYEDLVDPKWRDKLCLRSSNAVYNQSLVASKFVADGKDDTETWIKGMVANLAKNPAGGDTEQLLSLANGECDLTVVNTYYFGRLLASDDPKLSDAAKKIGVIWPNQKDRGTHVNVSGAGVTKHARNRDNAVRLIEFLTTPASQAWYAEVNNEYPVVPGTKVAARLKKLGQFKADNVNLQLLGKHNLEAVRMMDRGGWR